MTNSGSAIAATNTVNTVEYVAIIKEGQVRNYIWDVANSTWVKDPGTIVNISGLQITVDVSGDPVNVSGSAVFAYISGGSTSVSGNAVTVSGNWINISGNYIASGQVVTVSGNWIDISGALIASGQVVSISGNWVNISGNSIASGQVVTVSGNYVDISGNSIASGQVVTVSGNWVDISGAYFASGQVVNVSGNAVTVSGNTVNAYPKETFVTLTSGLDAGVGDTSAALIHTITTTRESYYMYSAIHLGSSAAVSTDVVTAYLNPAGVANMSGTKIYTGTLDSGTYNMFIGIPSGAPNPLALASGDAITINVPMANFITGDKVTARIVIKTV